MGGAAEANHRIVQNAVRFSGLSVTDHRALGHGARYRGATLILQGIERIFEVVFADRGQEAEATQIDSKDWNLRAVEQLEPACRRAVWTRTERYHRRPSPAERPRWMRICPFR